MDVFDNEKLFFSYKVYGYKGYFFKKYIIETQKYSNPIARSSNKILDPTLLLSLTMHQDQTLVNLVRC